MSKPDLLAALWCSYRGEGFHGYQAQGSLRTVQAELLRAFQEAGLPRNPVVAGRTDRGVSARMQVLSARMHRGVALDTVRERLNAALPDDVRIELIRPAPEKFHAAWSASGKVYRYQASDVDLEPLREAAALVPGTRTFRVFHFKTSEARVRTVSSVHVDDALMVTFTGDAFARHMVRMLMGAMLGVARGKLSRETFVAGLEREVFFHCPVAPPEPLTLWEVLYPSEVDPFSAEDRRSSRPLELVTAPTQVGSRVRCGRAT